MAVAQVNVKVGDISGNIDKIREHYHRATTVAQGIDLVVTPELAIAGYAPEDLLLDQIWQQQQDNILATLAALTAGNTAALLVGMPIWETSETSALIGSKLYNAAVLFANGAEIGRHYKRHLPNYGVFDEQRYFHSPEASALPITLGSIKLGVMVCEDMWYEDVAAELAAAGAQIIIVLNASPYETDKRQQRLSFANSITKAHSLPLVYCNLVGGQDELVFDGASFVMNANSSLQQVAAVWGEDLLIADILPTTAVSQQVAMPAQDHGDVYQGLILSLRDYIHKNGFRNVLLGLSGGIDSALVMVLAADALGPSNVRAVMMPSDFTSAQSYDDAAALLHNLPCKQNLISIKALHQLALNELAPVFAQLPLDVTEENIQARLRGLLLMALSNKYGELLLATGNKSEYAVGYATLYGDMCGGFAPIKDVYKTLVYDLVSWRNSNIPYGSLAAVEHPIPQRILDKAPTAELRYNQKDEDSLPPYPVLDQILAYLIEGKSAITQLLDMGIEKDTIARIQQLMIHSEFKRRQAAPGTKITTKSFGKDWRYPITGRSVLMPNFVNTKG